MAIKERLRWSLLLAAGLFSLACDSVDGAGTVNDPGVEEARRHRRDMRHPSPDLRAPGPDLGGGAPDLGGGPGPGPTPNPPPAQCDQRHAGVTGIQVLVRIDEYHGLIHGRNGTHEIAYGTVTDQVWVFDKSVVDTGNVQLAMNVASAMDPSGLPNEIPLSPGQVVEAEGEYIPAATANAHDSHGAAAVIHYIHTPCGYVVINGSTYK